MKFPILTILAFSMLFSAYAPAQSYRSTVNDGNEYYGKKEYDKASELYDRAATANPERMESYFNRGNAAYRNNDIKTALDSYEKAGKRVRSARDLANTMYNAGNTFLNAAEQGAENPVLQQKAGGDAQQLRMEGYRQAIGMYKRALKINPDDSDARYNLTYAREKLDELQQQQNKENQDQDKKQKQDQEKNQDKDKQDKDKQDQKDKQDKQDEQQKKKQNQKDQENKEKAKPNEQEKSQPERKHNMSKQQAERILNALEQDEKDLQKKKRQQVNARVQVEKDW
jgi:tetratricopeptide (TPR) repeat protein